MNIRWSLFLLALLWWPAGVYAEEYGKYAFPNVCRPESLVGQFSATNSSYKFSGSCLLNKFSYRWTAEGSWGAPGNGRGAAMIAGPGTYRLSAQVSLPRPTAWSNWVEFVVTPPKKAIRKAPKAFGP